MTHQSRWCRSVFGIAGGVAIGWLSGCGVTESSSYRYYPPAITEMAARDHVLRTQNGLVRSLQSMTYIEPVMYPVGVRATGTNWLVVDFLIAKRTDLYPSHVGARFWWDLAPLQLKAERGKAIVLSRDTGVVVRLESFDMTSPPSEQMKAELHLLPNYAECTLYMEFKFGEHSYDVGVMPVVVRCGEIVREGEWVAVSFDDAWSRRADLKGIKAARLQVGKLIDPE